jgi:hypothetical protein
MDKRGSYCKFCNEFLHIIQINNLMFVPCIIRRNNQHNSQICTTALFIYAGSYMFRQ